MMHQNKLDLKKLFLANICSFEMAKKAAAAGFTCANTFFSYDPDGSLNDGAWLQNVTGSKMFPAINICLAIGMIEDLDSSVEVLKIDLYEYSGKYFLKYKDQTCQSENLVDVIIEFWLANKKK